MLLAPMDLQKYRHKQLKEFTNSIGVYALCDLDQVPLYVGQSKDGIRTRVRRHLTSARSDIIANRQLDVWEVAFVWAWPLEHVDQISQTEATLFHEFDPASPLINGTVPPEPASKAKLPEKLVLQVLPDDEIERRRQPRYRFPRQAQQVGVLLDYILETYDKKHLRRSLRAHFARLEQYYRDFQSDLVEELK